MKPVTPSHSSNWDALPGAALSVGVGLGATVGVLVAGVPGMLVGAGAGAAIGLIVGAAARSMHLSTHRRTS
jgi:hypothetical protein